MLRPERRRGEQNEQNRAIIRVVGLLGVLTLSAVAGMVVSGLSIPEGLLTSLVGILGTITGGLLTALNQSAPQPPQVAVPPPSSVREDNPAGKA